MEPRVQYVLSADGVRIAYTTLGEGTPFVFTANAWGDIDIFTQSPLYGPLPELVRESGLKAVVYDGRSAGQSDRDVADMSLSARVGDLEAVVDKLALERFALMGVVHGGCTAIAYAAKHPERVSRLLLVGAYPRGADYYSGTPMLRAIKALLDLAEENWEFFTLTLSNWLTGFTSAEAAQQMAGIYRDTMEPRDYRRLIAACEATDITDLLPQVRAPTLVIRDTSSQFSLFPEYTRTIAAAIPEAQLVTVDERPAMMAVVLDFLLVDNSGVAALRPPEPAAALRTVLFTDLVGHTEMMSRLGDERGRDVLREHERITREVLKAHGGTEVKTMGDGFMASFGSVTKAVECAVALQREIGNWKSEIGEKIDVRCGLNAGEPIEEDGDLFGATVILAARIAAKAEGGEILVADTVRGLCSGKGFLFADRGEFVAKGFEEPVRVYEVRWRE